MCIFSRQLAVQVRANALAPWVALTENVVETTAECNATVAHVVSRHQPSGQMPGIRSLRMHNRWWVWRERKGGFGDTTKTLENAGLRKSKQKRILKKWSQKIKHTISKSWVSNIKGRSRWRGSAGCLLHLAFRRSPLTSEKVAGGRQASGTVHREMQWAGQRRKRKSFLLKNWFPFWWLCSSLPQIPQRKY